MAHGEKYYHNYCNSYGVSCKVSILERDFVGTPVLLEAQKVPFTLTYENSSDFKFEPIRPSYGTANFVFGNGMDFNEFWTADEKQYKMAHYINGSLDWVGYVIPNGFAYELTGGVYYASLKASDGLSLLQNLSFTGSDGRPYGNLDLDYNDGFQFPWVLIATEILRKLDLDLNLWTCVDVYERSMVKTGDTRNADPLASSFVNVKTYIKDSQNKNTAYWYDANSSMNCEEVLKNLCYCFGAKVYQSKGVWRIKRINADADYGSGTTQRYWRKYNTAAVYLSPYETINEQITVPCATVSKAMIGTDHIIRMDDVYKNFRMNYKFAFVREGDSVVNLIKNNDFSDWNNTSKFSSPVFWTRWAEGSNWKLRARQVTINPSDAGGFTTGLEIGVQKTGIDGSGMDSVTHPWNSIRSNAFTLVTKGDRLFLSMWIKTVSYVDGYFLKQYPTFRMILKPTAYGRQYYLRNNTGGPKGLRGFSWTQEEDHNILSAREDVFFLLPVEISEGYNDSQKYNTDFKWWYFNVELDPIPESGELLFDIVGQLGPIAPTPSHNFPDMRTYFLAPNGSDPHRKMVTARDYMYTEGGGPLHHPIFTGIVLGAIPEPGERGEQQDYMYPNPNQNYSLQVEPIDLLNGDVYELDQISRILVPSNVSSQKNFWDTIDAQFGNSSLGLITVKSIMQQYVKPFMLMEGTIKCDATIDTKFIFEALPGREFCLLRGTFNERKNYIENATFFEISDNELPPGGTEGNIDLAANYQENGNKRCEKGVGFVNTGLVEYQYTDINTNSETYGDTVWVKNLSPDLTMCPIGEPDKYLWGTDDITLDVDNLINYVWSVNLENPNGIDVRVSNPGGEYIYFLHLDSLTIVEHVKTINQDDIISDFQYLSDLTINGYLYKVLRMNYQTAVYNNFLITFIFQ